MRWIGAALLAVTLDTVLGAEEAQPLELPCEDGATCASPGGSDLLRTKQDEDADTQLNIPDTASSLLASKFQVKRTMEVTDEKHSVEAPIEFKLKGRHGHESVTIKVGDQVDTFTVSKKLKTFTYPFPTNGVYSITFNVDNGDVYWKAVTPLANTVEIPRLWKTWRCGSTHENRRCRATRRGVFAWQGQYNIQPHPPAPIQFRLRGAKGWESVTINVGDKKTTLKVPKKAQSFSYPWPTNGVYSVTFNVDNGDVFWEPVTPLRNEVEFPRHWKGWNCDSGKENIRCQMVRDGTFAWQGQYNIEPQPTLLKQASFKGGTYRITQPGVYRLKEDIFFDPDPQFPDSLSQTYPQTGGYYLGFFAAVAIEVDHVIFDCQGHSIEMSPAFHKFQRFFSIFELGSKPFISAVGPPQFANVLLSPGEVVASKHVTIQNCRIGLSSHHSIHGNENEFVTLKNVKMKDFEVGGVHLNGGSHVLVEDCTIGPALTKTWGAMLSHAIFLDHLMNTLLPSVPELNSEREKVFVNLRGQTKTVGTVLDELRGHLQTFLQNSSGPLEPLVGNGTSLPDGSAVYGIVVNKRGPAVMDFGACPFAEAVEEDQLEESVTIRRVVIEGLDLRAEQWTRLVMDEKQVMGPGGDVFRYMKAKDSDGKYVGNTLADAQIAVGALKKHLVGLGSSDEELAWYFGGVHMPDAIVEWAKGTDVLVADQQYECFGDAMSHVNKGVVGLRLEYVEGVKLEDVLIKDLVNEGTDDADSSLCSSETASAGEDYIGKDVTGASIANCKKVDRTGLKVEKDSFVSVYGGKIYGVRNFWTCEDVAGNVVRCKKRKQ